MGRFAFMGVAMGKPSLGTPLEPVNFRLSPADRRALRLMAIARRASIAELLRRWIAEQLAAAGIAGDSG